MTEQLTSEQRLRRLEDREAILDRLASYGRAIDEGLDEEFADCWTEDAVLEWLPTSHRELGFSPQRFAGRRAIMGAFAAHTHAPDMFHQHLVSQPRVHLEHGRASVFSIFQRVNETPDGPVLGSFGCYEDELVRCDDGVWRLRSRRADIRAVVPLASAHGIARQ